MQKHSDFGCRRERPAIKSQERNEQNAKIKKSGKEQHKIPWLARGEQGILLVDQYDQRVFIEVPAQRLTATAAESLVFPLRRDVTTEANRIGMSASKHMDFGNCHREPERFSQGQGGISNSRMFSHITPAVAETANGLRSSVSNTSAIRQSSLMVEFASPCPREQQVDVQHFRLGIRRLLISTDKKGRHPIKEQ